MPNWTDLDTTLEHTAWRSATPAQRKRSVESFNGLASWQTGCWCHPVGGCRSSDCSRCGLCDNNGNRWAKASWFEMYVREHHPRLKITRRLIYADGSAIPCNLFRDVETIMRPFMAPARDTPPPAMAWTVFDYAARGKGCPRREVCDCTVENPEVLSSGCADCLYNFSHREHGIQHAKAFLQYAAALGINVSRNVRNRIDELAREEADTFYEGEATVGDIRVTGGRIAPAAVVVQGPDGPQEMRMTIPTEQRTFGGYAVPTNVNWAEAIRRYQLGEEVLCGPRVGCSGAACSACLLCANVGDVDTKRALFRSYATQVLSVNLPDGTYADVPEFDVPVNPGHKYSERAQFLMRLAARRNRPRLAPGMLIKLINPVPFDGDDAEVTNWGLVVGNRDSSAVLVLTCLAESESLTGSGSLTFGQIYSVDAEPPVGRTPDIDIIYRLARSGPVPEGSPRFLGNHRIAAVIQRQPPEFDRFLEWCTLGYAVELDRAEQEAMRSPAEDRVFAEGSQGVTLTAEMAEGSADSMHVLRDLTAQGIPVPDEHPVPDELAALVTGAASTPPRSVRFPRFPRPVNTTCMMETTPPYTSAEVEAMTTRGVDRALFGADSTAAGVATAALDRIAVDARAGVAAGQLVEQTREYLERLYTNYATSDGGSPIAYSLDTIETSGGETCSSESSQ